MIFSKLLQPKISTKIRHVGLVYIHKNFSKSSTSYEKLKVAVIGQSTFAAGVYKLLLRDGHKVVGVFTVPDKGNKEDPLGKSKFFLAWWGKPKKIFLVLKKFALVNQTL